MVCLGFEPVAHLMVSTDDIVVPPPDSFGNEESVKSQPEPDVTSGAHQPDLVS